MLCSSRAATAFGPVRSPGGFPTWMWRPRSRNSWGSRCPRRRASRCPSNDRLRVSPHMVETIEWTADGVVMIDQTRLPLHEEYVTCRNYEEVATAIRDMIIRGASAIGVAVAMGVAIGV